MAETPPAETENKATDINTAEEQQPSQDGAPPKKQIDPASGMNPKKKVWFIAGGIIAALIIIAGLVYAIGGKSSPSATKSSPTPIAIASPTPTPTPEPPKQLPAQLDGVLTDSASASKHPLAVMVENHPDARPQSGLTEASVVYEAVAEGGITRFMAVYQEAIPAKVGPVRSARDHFVSWVEAYLPRSAYYAHFGGSATALARIGNEGVFNLDGMTTAASAFYRIPKAGIASEHTSYATPSKLLAVAAQNKWTTDSTFVPWKFKDDALNASRGNTQTITLPFSEATYQVKYVYNKLENNYARFLAGLAHNDANNGQQLKPKNIAVIYTSYSDVIEGGKSVHVGITTGTGKATVFEDGLTIDATWSRPTNASMLKITHNATGQEVQFNRGQTWIEAMPSNRVAVVQGT